jgi:hypothetical protein
MFQIVRPPIEPAGASLDRSRAHPLDFAYDCETLVNTFTCTIEHIETGCRWIFEISDRCNHSHELYAFIDWLRIYDARMVGFNNVGFDYPVIHLFWQLYIEQDGVVYAKQLHEKAMSIIGSYGDNRFQNIVWERDRIVRQLDLYLIHHFDNRAKTTGLKMLEFQMRSGDIEVMEDDPNEPLPEHRTPVLIKYNAHDVRETVKFYFHSLPQITMRDELSTKYGIDFTNFNDTKIGKQYFINRLEAVSPGICHTKVNGKRQPRQTHRDTIDLNEIIFPYIQFSDPDGPFPGVLQRMRGIVLDAYDINSPPQMKDLSATYKGFKFDFGAGGIHGSQHGVTVRADDRYMILDIDVTSYYPSLAIANRVFPEHLGETFCDVYAELKAERLKHPKKSVENGMLKLALNGVYGDSNNQYGPFYDPQYTMTITVNGQLLLTMLAEKLMFIPNLTMLQINTDGLTVRVERHNEQLVRQVCEWWQNLTGMQLEDAEYQAMFIRDVNNYTAIDTSGGVKRKGAFQWKTDDPTNLSKSLVWHQNWSALVAPYAAERVLLHGEQLEQVVRDHADPFDFMLRTKIPRGSRLTYGKDGAELQNITRYHMALRGEQLYKMMSPLKSKGGIDWRYFRVHVDQPVNVCNDVTRFDWNNLDYDWYIKEARKLTDAVAGTL